MHDFGSCDGSCIYKSFENAADCDVNIASRRAHVTLLISDGFDSGVLHAKVWISESRDFYVGSANIDRKANIADVYVLISSFKGRKMHIQFPKDQFANVEKMKLQDDRQRAGRYFKNPLKILALLITFNVGIVDSLYIGNNGKQDNYHCGYEVNNGQDIVVVQGDIVHQLITRHTLGIVVVVGVEPTKDKGGIASLIHPCWGGSRSKKKKNEKLMTK